VRRFIEGEYDHKTSSELGLQDPIENLYELLAFGGAFEHETSFDIDLLKSCLRWQGKEKPEEVPRFSYGVAWGRFRVIQSVFGIDETQRFRGLKAWARVRSLHVAT
jgi:hypothetical protein